MGSTGPGPIHLLELCDQKLMEFICNVDNKDLVWLEEIEEEAERMFTREFSKEPELMPKTPSQKNRRKKRRVSYVQDENRDPIRKSRLSRRKTRSSQLSSRHLRSKDKVERLATVVGENGSVLRRMTRAAAAAVAATAASAAPSSSPESPTALTKKPRNSLAEGPLVPVVEISVSERRSAEQHLRGIKSAQSPSRAPSPPAAVPASPGMSMSEEESTPKKPEARRLESVTVTSLMATPQDSKGRGVGASRSASKLRIAQASPGPQDLLGSPASPWQERVLAPILPDNCSTPTGTRVDRQSVRRSLIAPSSPGRQVSLAEKYSLVDRKDKPVRRSSRRIGKKAAEEPAASARIICHSYLERLLNVEVPQKVGPEQKPGKEAEPVEAADPEVPKSASRSATKIAISTPGSRPVAGGQETPSEGQQEPKTDQADGPKERPQSVRRKRSYKQAVSELDGELQLEDAEPQLEDVEPQAPRSKTPSPPCPASKVVRPLRTFLHTVQRNQMLMTPTSAPRSGVMKSFIKRNTPVRVDPKCSFVEKERQRLENLRRKEEAELLRRQKVEEDKRRRLEEVKLKREERLRKVLQARERVEQMKEEKKKQIEQKFAQIDEKTEKAKEERLAEEKARKKAAAKKMEEVEARRKQEEEARRLRRLQQDEEERRHQELQKKKEEEQERLRRAAEAKRLAEQREQERQLAEQREQERRREQERLQAERELQEREREKALRLQKERLQRELEEKKKKEEEQRLAEERLQEEQQRKARVAAAAAAAAASKGLNVTVDVQSPACTSYQMTPQGHRAPPKINPDNYGMDLNSDDSTDDEAHPRKPIPTWARGTQLSQAIIHQYYHPPNLLELFGTILPLDLEDIFKKSKPRYHKRTSSAVWNSPPLLGARVPSSLAYSLKKY
ncbi:inner centromere protein isoform X1 [Lutra lutra]|uniref:inner centromere protein isoform X1 n=1 Tax=Lutra lutra TaxID=9657 RepID=UPI001FD0F39E|nr:inner centromere protein isoform X1 [Lutra lutra]